MRSIVLAVVLASLASLLTATPTPTDPKHLRSSITPITVKGNAFWQGDKRFYVRGIDYQPGGSSAMQDPLANETVCKRDIDEFVKLGVNAIRVYMTDNSVSHDVCMGALADAGIYVIIDANNPLYSINRDDPKPSYNAEYLQSVFSTIDAFSKYDNTMAFFSGNEVVNDDINSTYAAVYVKATTRDMRQYIASRGHRKIPVGYSSADIAKNHIQLAHYMNCGSDDQRSDFFAFNDYSWCKSDMETSGWNQKVKDFTGYGIPIFLSEWGCTTNGRDFGEVKALMSNAMTSVYSGGLMYEYSWGINEFGIVNVSTSSAQELPEFALYKSALAANPAPDGDGGCTLTSNSVPCPTKDDTWLVDNTSLPPMPEKAKAFMADGAGTGPGLKGTGSQNVGDGDSNSETTTTPGPTATTSASTSKSTSKSTSTSTSGTGSGTGTTATPSSSKNAAGGFVGGPVDKGPFVVTGMFIAFSLMGTLLL